MGILFDDYPISSQQRDAFAKTSLFCDSYRLLKNKKKKKKKKNQKKQFLLCIRTTLSSSYGEERQISLLATHTYFP